MGSGYRAYVLFILVISYTFNFIDRVIVGILAGPIKAELHLTDTQLGWMGGAAFAVFYTLLGIPIARLADRTSRTWIMTAALALWSAFTALCGVAQSFWQLLLARAGVGVGEAGGVAPAYSLVSDYYPPQQRARALAVFSFGIPIGSGLGFLFGGLIASAMDWRSAFLIVGIAGLVLAPLFRLTVVEPLRGGLDAGMRPTRPSSVGEVLRALRRKLGFWGLSFGAACSSIVGYGLLFWLPSFFIRVHGLSLADTSLVVGLGIIVFQPIGIWVGGWAADRFGGQRKSTYALVPAVLLATVIPFMVAGALAPSLGTALLLFLIPVTLNAAWLGPVLSAIQHIVVPSQRATASAIFLFINNLIGIGGGALFMGVVSDLFMPRYGNESLRYAMIAACAFYVLSVSILYFASRHLDRDWERA
jgi:predicted MFS family arabinose efflux permease